MSGVSKLTIAWEGEAIYAVIVSAGNVRNQVDWRGAAWDRGALRMCVITRPRWTERMISAGA